ncbi:hypothetical protein C8R43DRAFT_610002 [Mycena crocata]|nr:hypothetical protein C8R43DRAFT_610002 [Mycena crocata]
MTDMQDIYGLKTNKRQVKLPGPSSYYHSSVALKTSLILTAFCRFHPPLRCAPPPPLPSTTLLRHTPGWPEPATAPRPRQSTIMGPSAAAAAGEADLTPRTARLAPMPGSDHPCMLAGPLCSQRHRFHLTINLFSSFRTSNQSAINRAPSRRWYYAPPPRIWTRGRTMDGWIPIERQPARLQRSWLALHCFCCYRNTKSR